jgi:hypothetical protein
MQLKACLNTSGMGGLAFQQTESETHTSNNWHLFTPEMGWFNIFKWILTCRWFDCQGNLERRKKTYYIGANLHSATILYSESKHNILAYQGKANNKTQLLSFSEEKVFEKAWRNFSFKAFGERETCVNGLHCDYPD